MASVQSWSQTQIGSGPRYAAMSDADLLDRSLDEPLSMATTGAGSLVSGLLRSPGIGTALRDTFIPQGNRDPFSAASLQGLAAGSLSTPVPGLYPAIQGAVQSVINPDEPTMPETEWKQSRFFRKDIPWDGAMTKTRAEALADAFDAQQVRDFYASKRPVSAFVGGFVGQAFDPVNYLPIFGQATRTASFANSVGRAALDAAANTAIAGLVTREARAQYGDDTSLEAIATDVAMAALIGSAFGGVSYGLGKRSDAKARLAASERAATLKATQDAKIALNEAIQSLATSDTVALGPNSTDAIQRTATKLERALIDRESVVVTPTGMRIGVRQEVVDASELLAASGELQPRDRTRAASDTQINDIAANLDPARLFPTPEADRGAPIVGPDNVVESGNGRVAALRRAAEAYPERFEAYRKALKDAGYTMPETGVPILISRRTSELTDADRVRFVGDANTSSIARMSATETALMDVRAMTDGVVDTYVAGGVTAAANRPFVSSFLRGLPENERASLVDASGALNADGARRVERALVAAAYGDTDVVAKFAEAIDDNARSITGALSDVAGQWSRMRRNFVERAAGAELDVTGNLLDALRTISRARETAAAEGRPVSRVLDEAMAQKDIFAGEFDPATRELIRALYQDDGLKRAKSREDIALFLENLAEEIQNLAQPQLFGDAARFTPQEMIASVRRSEDRSLFDRPEPSSGGNRAGGSQDGAADRQSVVREPGDENFGLADAKARVGKTDNLKAIAEQHGVDPVTGDFAELADIAQVEAEGRLTQADRDELAAADQTFEHGEAYDRALQAAVRCLV